MSPSLVQGTSYKLGVESQNPTKVRLCRNVKLRWSNSERQSDVLTPKKSISQMTHTFYISVEILILDLIKLLTSIKF